MPRDGLSFWWTYDVPHGLPWDFTTTGFNSMVPGLEKAYGPNKRLGIRAIPKTGGDVNVDSNGVIEMNGDIHMELLI